MNVPKAAFTFILAAALALTACSAAPEPAPAPGPETPAAAGAAVTPETHEPEPPGSPGPEPDEFEAMREAYERALNKLYYEKIMPDGTSVDEGFDMGMDLFAVYDVDFDGRDELIIQHNNAPMAGKTEVVYAYDSESGLLVEEFSQFPALVWYDNGVIMALFSHNQGLAGRFWPYFLYVYDSGRDRYDCVGMVDAWDSSIFDRDFDGNPFPAEIDVSGEGIVYYIMEPDEYNLDKPVDKSGYESWLDGYIAGAAPFDVPFVPLEPENLLFLTYFS